MLFRSTDADPKFREELEFKPVYNRTVTNANIDNLGHVNNVRYNEFCYDAMGLEETKNMDKLKKMQLYFHSEMHLGDEFKVGVSRYNGQEAYEVYNLTKNEKSFTMLIEYKE